MARTTLDIDSPILEEIRKLREEEGLSMGKLVSRLLAEALARRGSRVRKATLRWVSRPMNPLVDLSDKEAVYAALDRHDEHDIKDDG